MKFTTQSITLLSLLGQTSLFFTAATESGSVFRNQDDCSLVIGQRDDRDNLHRRMVSVNLLPERCEDNDIVSIGIPHDGSTRSFNKVMSSPRQTKNSEEVPSSFGYWYGEDPNGSSFNYVQDANGNIEGSLVDMSNHSVMQFSIEDGAPTVIITASSDFPPEIDPEEDPELYNRKLSKSVTTSTARTKTHIRKGSSMKSNLQINSVSTSQSNDKRNLDDDDGGGNLDVMVVWTEDAECKNNGQNVGCTLTDATTTAMEARINLAVQETNAAYTLSGVNTKLLLVHSYRHPTYSESSFSGSLNDLRNGVLSGTEDKREEYGADFVALIIHDSQYCGIAYLGPRVDLMYSVTAWNCATGYFSFGHEIGHNMGLNHDKGTSNACNNPAYNYGYRDPDARFRSILAYSCRSGQCDNNAGNGSCTRVQRFSNPNSGYNGSPIGTATSDNARQINDVRVQVAKYFPHGGTGTATPSKAPVKAPTSSPVESPTFPITATPSKAPVKAPTSSPVESPTSSPTKPTTLGPISTPTVSPTFPITSLPPSPITRNCADFCYENKGALFLLKVKNGESQYETCEELAKMRDNKKKRICRKEKKSRNGYGPASVHCRVTCSEWRNQECSS